MSADDPTWDELDPETRERLTQYFYNVIVPLAEMTGEIEDANEIVLAAIRSEEAQC